MFDNAGHENAAGSAGFAGWSWSELYMGGMHVNTYTNGSTYFAHSDDLGTPRTQSDPTGNTNGSYFRNLPFGDWYDHGTQGWLGFTGDLLDDPDGNNFHTPNREYEEYEGRWMTPDPAGLAAVDITNPQSWNRYAYVMNNPMSYVDPTGLEYLPSADPMAAMGGLEACPDGSQADVCVTASPFTIPYGGSPNCAQTDGACDLEDYVNRGMKQLVSGLQQATDTVLNWFSTPRDPGCMAGAMATGSGIGAAAGGTLGLAGGPGSVVTVPGGAEIGLTLGATAGAGVGFIKCTTGSGATDHGNQRMGERNISQGDVNEAIKTAEQTGQVTTTTGKYGTPQNVYNGTNGLTVVVETAGANAGKVITAWWR